MINNKHVVKAPLSQQVNQTVETYFEHMNGEVVTDLYELVIGEVEKGLLLSVLKKTADNQSEAARMLGISRTTLRKKIAVYQLNQTTN